MRARLAQRRLVVCIGAGGVGKTTTAAALALGLARNGARVAVVTIDPARRLADVLGLSALDDAPRRVDASALDGDGAADAGGELWALTLDARRTFDALIAEVAPDAGARDALLANRVYRHVVGAVAGSQELAAIAKVHELDRSDRFDVVVLDTPPSRNALDFLDAPERVTRFLDGGAFGALPTPGGGIAGRVLGIGAGAALGVIGRFAGAELVAELTAFARGVGRVADDVRERARVVDALLRDEATAFVLVTTPEPAPAQEAAFLAQRLRESAIAPAELVVNRVRRAPEVDDAELAALAATLGDAGLAARVRATYEDERVLAERDAAIVASLARRVGASAPVVVPELDGGADAASGLARMRAYLRGEAR